MTKLEVYNETVPEISNEFANSDVADERRLAQLRAMVRLTLGNALEAPTFDAMAANQKQLELTQQALMARLNGGDLSPVDYVTECTHLVEAAMEGNRSILGVERFKLMFEIPTPTV